jgi:hypothetical protein
VKRDKTLSPIFSLGIWNYSPKIRVGGATWAPQATRACLGPRACPGALWAQGGPPLVVLRSSIFHLFNKKSHKISGHLELRRIAISAVALLGPEFQLPAISLFMSNLHSKREKALELHHKVKYWSKTL